MPRSADRLRASSVRRRVAPYRVLVVDDEDDTSRAMCALMQDAGFACDAVAAADAALAAVAERPYDALVVDLGLPGMSGLELLHRVRKQNVGLALVVVTAEAEVKTVVRAVRDGADDYLTKPVDARALAASLCDAIHRRQPAPSQPSWPPGAGLDVLVGDSPPMRDVRDLSRRVAGSQATVLVTGESGTGKGELARAIHAESRRSSGPFVELHCASLSEGVLESELFGHERGAFTGADRRRAGRFEQADGGTLFLDEVGEIPPAVQVKLLRVLQERAFERVGGNETVHVDVRLIAATNRDLEGDVRAGRFRDDLFYRLRVIRIEMPPLRDRGADVLLLAERFLARFARLNDKRVDGFTSEAAAQLLAYPWPGNVRELENAIESAVVLCSGTRVGVEDLSGAGPSSLARPARPPGATLAELERSAILSALEATGGSTAKAAELLGISVRTIQYRLQAYGLRARYFRKG